ncbi:MAG: polyphosphate kinase 1 [Nitrospiraceae bacterium]
MDEPRTSPTFSSETSSTTALNGDVAPSPSNRDNRTTEPSGESAAAPVRLDNPTLYLNRELSWLAFNARVLEEAERATHPLLERVKFLSIYHTNLDEFFMIRVSGLRAQLARGSGEVSPDGMAAPELLAAIDRVIDAHNKRIVRLWEEELRPALAQAGVRILDWPHVASAQRQALRVRFLEEIFPILTPLAFDPSHPFPHISNLSLNMAVVAHDPEQGICFARLKVPGSCPRLVAISETPGLSRSTDGREAVQEFVWLEDLIADNADLLFPGLKLEAWYPFRVTRDADLAIEEDEASDLLETIETQIDLREFGSVVRLEVAEGTPAPIRELLSRNLQLMPSQVHVAAIRLGLAQVMELMKIERPDLKDPPFQQTLADIFSQRPAMEQIRKRSILLAQPYHSFLPVVDFIRQAAADPNVLAIKQTLYRVGSKSPIVDALVEARQNGKQVAVLLELKARFDEENNIEWARRLEDEGVHVVYGVMGLKTHAKICMVVRRDDDRIRRYLHLGTGNYNVATSRIYTDFGLFTCDEAMGQDATLLFNALTGYARTTTYSKLLVAPHGMRTQVLERIERECERHRTHGDGYLAFKMNALVDPACIQALYRASQIGVRVELMIRGICCLRPGVPGISETIAVRSIVGRFLEHSRLYYFRNGGADELFLGSADLMPRNLDRRVEILFPIESAATRMAVMEQVFDGNWNDTVHARQLHEDGRYLPLPVQPDTTPYNSQAGLLLRAQEGRLLS